MQRKKIVQRREQQFLIEQARKFSVLHRQRKKFETRTPFLAPNHTLGIAAPTIPYVTVGMWLVRCF